jgi:cell division protein FtsB
MSTRQRKKSYIRPLVVPFIALCFSGYFAWHGWHGSFGIEARHALQRELDARAGDLHRLEQERVTAERRVSLLRAQSLESDMLDERARDILGFAQADELVVFSSPDKATALNRK